MQSFSGENKNYKNLTTVRHQGTLIVFSTGETEANKRTDIYYHVLDSNVELSNENQDWNNLQRLILPQQVRPVGIGLLREDIALVKKQSVDTPFRILSDNLHIYIFRQSVNGTLYVDRFVFDALTHELKLNWETRYRRSGKLDVPATPKDTLGYKDMENQPFIEPTTELTLVKNLKDGWFSVLLLPSAVPGEGWWQIFAYNAVTEKVDAFTICRSQDGLFDLTDFSVDKDKTSFTLSRQDGANAIPLKFQSAPSATLYMQQEEVIDAYGRQQPVKRAGHVMLTVAAGSQAGANSIAVVDFAVSKRGTLSLVSYEAQDSGEAEYALEFAGNGGYVEVKEPKNLNPDESFWTVEAWVKTTALQGSIIYRDRTGETDFYALRLQDGKAVFSFRLGSQEEAITVVSASNINDGKWHHLVGVRKWVAITGTQTRTQTAEIFVDGKLDGTRSQEGKNKFINTNQPFKIGQGFAGAISEVRIWKKARTAQEIRDYYLAQSLGYIAKDDETDLVSYWRLNEGSGNQVTDVKCNDEGKLTDTIKPAWVRSLRQLELLRRRFEPLPLKPLTNTPSNLSLSPIYTNPRGLTVSTGLLDFAQTKGTPFLMDSADGLLHLYFQGANDKFLAAQYNTLTRRAEYTAPLAQDGQPQFIARWSGTPMNNASITIDNQPNSDLCQVTLSVNSRATETWKNVPRDLNKFLAILNGVAGEDYDYNKNASSTHPQTDLSNGSLLFVVAAKTGVNDGTVKVKNIATKAEYSLAGKKERIKFIARQIGTQINDAVIKVENQPGSRPNSNVCQVTITSSAGNQTWSNVPRDFQPFALALKDSTLFTVIADANVKDAVVNTDRAVLDKPGTDPVTLQKPGIDCQWSAEPAKNVLGLNGENYVELPSDSLDLTRDMTLEAWVKPATLATASFPRLVHYQSPKSQYVLGLAKSGATDTYSLIAGTQDSAKQSSANSIPVDKWTHLAATYQSSYALKLDGVDDYIDGGNDLTLNQSQAITVEVWFERERTDVAEVLISKWGEAEDQQSWQLFIDRENRPCFVVKDADNQPVGIKADIQLQPGKTYHLVGIFDVSEAAKAKDACVQKIQVREVGDTSGRWVTETVELLSVDNQIFDSQTAINLGRAGSENYFQGLLHEVRLWNVSHTQQQLDNDKNRRLAGNEDGLVSCWRFDEGSGEKANDLTGHNHGTLRVGNLQQINQKWIPSTFGSKWVFYINGTEVSTSDIDAHSSYTDASQFTLGAMLNGGAIANPLKGLLSEVRIWNQVRTPEQIRHTMHRPLLGHEDGLVGYWSFDANTKATVEDQTANRNHGKLTDPETMWAKSNVPVSNEAPEVMNVLSPVETPFSQDIHGQVAVVEYGNVQYKPEGSVTGAIARCYVYTNKTDHSIKLVTGYKVGNLEQQYLGQVHTQPTLVGYIEGAPPVPCGDGGVSSIELTESNTTVEHYSTSLNSGEVDLIVVKHPSQLEPQNGINATFQASNGWLNDAGFNSKTTNSPTKSLMLRASRKEQTSNVGYAVVKLGSAELYAVKLNNTGTLVALRAVPNPNELEEINIIPFQLNPQYISNDSLDSYNKPAEAYALRERIRREERNLLAYYEQSNIAKSEELTSNNSQEKLAKRSIVNSYFWTVTGGICAEEKGSLTVRAEEEDTLTVRQESLSRYFSHKSQLNFSINSAAGGVGGFTELDALFDGHLEFSAIATAENTSAVRLNVNVECENPSPGKVNTYRLMSIYLAPAINSFNTFFETVVDPQWLAKNTADAQVLREAKALKNKVWRVLHRVTFIG